MLRRRRHPNESYLYISIRNGAVFVRRCAKMFAAMDRDVEALVLAMQSEHVHLVDLLARPRTHIGISMLYSHAVSGVARSGD